MRLQEVSSQPAVAAAQLTRIVIQPGKPFPFGNWSARRSDPQRRHRGIDDFQRRLSLWRKRQRSLPAGWHGALAGAQRSLTVTELHHTIPTPVSDRRRTVPLGRRHLCLLKNIGLPISHSAHDRISRCSCFSGWTTPKACAGNCATQPLPLPLSDHPGEDSGFVRGGWLVPDQQGLPRRVITTGQAGSNRQGTGAFGQPFQGDSTTSPDPRRSDSIPRTKTKDKGCLLERIQQNRFSPCKAPHCPILGKISLTYSNCGRNAASLLAAQLQDSASALALGIKDKAANIAWR